MMSLNVLLLFKCSSQVLVGQVPDSSKHADRQTRTFCRWSSCCAYVERCTCCRRKTEVNVGGRRRWGEYHDQPDTSVFDHAVPDAPDMQASLNSIRCRIESYCNWRITGIMWSRRLANEACGCVLQPSVCCTAESYSSPGDKKRTPGVFFCSVWPNNWTCSVCLGRTRTDEAQWHGRTLSCQEWRAQAQQPCHSLTYS